jgi:hypothetical protein
MTNRKQMLCFAAFAALVALSGVARADDYAYPVVALNETRAEDRGAEPASCEQATRDAWFKHQMEQSDGSFDTTTEVPAECQRELIAAYEESK